MSLAAERATHFHLKMGVLMADKPQQDGAQTDRQASEPIRDAGAIGRKATQPTTDTNPEGVQVGPAIGEAFAQTGEAVSQTTRRSVEAGVEVVHRISNTAGEAVRRGGQAVVDGRIHDVAGDECLNVVPEFG